jgi:class 3 adenylate cyclase
MVQKPRYFSIVAFDIERLAADSRTVPDATHERVFALVEEALAASMIPADEVHAGECGDGGFLLIGAGVAKSDIGESFIRNLNTGLHRHAFLTGRPTDIRLRVALHAGDVARDARGWVGNELNTAFRLVDAPALRAAMTAADKAHMAVVVSWTWYDAVVWHQRGGIDRSTYRRVPLDLRDKRTTAWIHVPGYLVPPVGGLPEEEAPGRRQRPDMPHHHARSSTHLGGNALHVRADPHAGRDQIGTER